MLQTKILKFSESVFDDLQQPHRPLEKIIVRWMLCERAFTAFPIVDELSNQIDCV
jgi:hypothetical protein